MNIITPRWVQALYEQSKPSVKCDSTEQPASNFATSHRDPFVWLSSHDGSFYEIKLNNLKLIDELFEFILICPTNILKVHYSRFCTDIHQFGNAQPTLWSQFLIRQKLTKFNNCNSIIPRYLNILTINKAQQWNEYLRNYRRRIVPIQYRVKRAQVSKLALSHERTYTIKWENILLRNYSYWGDGRSATSQAPIEVLPVRLYSGTALDHNGGKGRMCIHPPTPPPHPYWVAPLMRWQADG